MSESLPMWPDDKPCPAHTDGRPCCGEYAPDDASDGTTCQTFVCAKCLRAVPWCVGASDSDLCDECWCSEVNDENEGNPT